MVKVKAKTIDIIVPVNEGFNHPMVKVKEKKLATLDGFRKVSTTLW